MPFQYQPLFLNLQLGNASDPQHLEVSLDFVLMMQPSSNGAVGKLAATASRSTTVRCANSVLSKAPDFWTPIPLRRLTLAVLIGYFVTLIITFAVVFIISNRN